VSRGRLDPALQNAPHLPKPQLLFKKKVDNEDDSPWYPTLPHKYNAQVPLGHKYRDSDEITSTSLHPYQYEIKHITYPTRMFQTFPPIPPKSFDETPFSWVSAPSEFAVMLDKLRSAKEIAVDLEHHDYRSWTGFLCLMQISTREEDFVVDTLVLREELQELNEVFTDPAIVKVSSTSVHTPFIFC
jgi:exosome complex exonuclease RRP6